MEAAWAHAHARVHVCVPTTVCANCGVLTTPLEVLLDGAELCEQGPLAERRSRRALRTLSPLRTRVRGGGG